MAQILFHAVLISSTALRLLLYLVFGLKMKNTLCSDLSHVETHVEVKKGILFSFGLYWINSTSIIDSLTLQDIRG